MSRDDHDDEFETFSNEDFETHNFYSMHDGTPARKPFKNRQPPKVAPKTEEERASDRQDREEENRLPEDFSERVESGADWLRLLQNINKHHGSIAEFLRTTNWTRSKFYRDRIRVMMILRVLHREMLRRRRLR